MLLVILTISCLICIYYDIMFLIKNSLSGNLDNT